MGLMYYTIDSGTASQATPRGRHRKRAGRARTDDQTIVSPSPLPQDHEIPCLFLQQWFPMTIMRQGLKNRASILHPCQLKEAILICMEPSILIRHGSCCISAAACDLLVVEIIVSLLSLLLVIELLKNTRTYTLLFCMRV
jgi:hypothetical protein